MWSLIRPNGVLILGAVHWWGGGGGTCLAPNLGFTDKGGVWGFRVEGLGFRAYKHT